jgi:hypothetical protein
MDMARYLKTKPLIPEYRQSDNRQREWLSRSSRCRGLVQVANGVEPGEA